MQNIQRLQIVLKGVDFDHHFDTPERIGKRVALSYVRSRDEGSVLLLDGRSTDLWLCPLDGTHPCTVHAGWLDLLGAVYEIDRIQPLLGKHAVDVVARGQEDY